MADDGELIESGTFRVDRKKALEKLKEFQLPDPTMFLLPWVRCAVASGATRITIEEFTSKGGMLSMQFDGRPFAAGELKDPYGCLLDESTPENARNRHLAIGLLTVLGRNPRSVTVISGNGLDRVCLRVVSLERESLKGWQGDSSETSITVQWPKIVLSRHIPPIDPILRVADHYQGGPVAITFTSPRLRKSDIEKRQPRQSAHGLQVCFEEEGVRGWVEVPGDTFPIVGPIRFHVFGVFAEAVNVKFALARVKGSINDDRLTLNVSQSGIVRNECFQKTLEVVAAQAGKLLLQEIPFQAARLAEVGQFVRRPMLLRAWADWLTRGEEAERAGSVNLSEGLGGWIRSLFGPPPEWETDLVQKIRRAARVTVWLRETCKQRRHDFEKAPSNPTLQALREAPIFLSVGYKPLSLRQLEEQLRHDRDGRVLFSTQPYPGLTLPFDVAWCACEADHDCLAGLFPDRIQDITTGLAKGWSKASA